MSHTLNPIKMGRYGSNTVHISFWSLARVDNYVCVRCGYVESYIASLRKLRKIKERWPRLR